MTDSFALFIDKISMYPTIIFTGMVMFVTLYWLVSLIGVADMDSVDLGSGDISGGDIGDFGGGDASGDVSNMGDASTAGLFTGLMLKFGLYGVPLVVILTGISLIGWLLSYLYTSFLYANTMSPVLHYVFGTGAFILVLVASMWLTGLIIAPIRKKVAPTPKRNASSNIGKIATVRTLTVTDKHGEALLNDGGAGLILRVRQEDLADTKPLKQGDQVQLVEYLEADNAYRVESVRD